MHHQSIQDTAQPSNYEILHQVSDERVSVEGHEAVMPDSSSTLVRLEESDYTSLGIFLPDYLIKKMEGSCF